MEDDALEKTARQFLKTGSDSSVSESDLIASCDKVIQKASVRSFKTGLTLARQFVIRSRGRSRPLQLAAHRQYARLNHLSGKHRPALKAYLAARRLTASDAATRGRIDRALVDVYMYLGDYAAARKSARRAVHVFTKLKLDSDLAQTRVNFANLLHRLDRHNDAARMYRQALNYFETTKHVAAIAKCQYNLANSLVQLFEIEEAEKLYLKALSTYDELGHELDVCDSRYGLAWLHMLSGKLHTALLELKACERIYSKGGDTRGAALCRLDLAEVYLHLGLYLEARESARGAVRDFGKLGLAYEKSKACLFAAQAASALGIKSEANSLLRVSEQGFGRSGNRGFTAVVRLAQADLRHDKHGRESRFDQARELFRRSQLPLWMAVCDLKDCENPAHTAAALQRLNHNSAVRHVPHLFATWKTHRGDQDFGRGKVRDAEAQWQEAADRIDLVRATLPPIELRTSYGRSIVSPHARLVSLSLEGDPVSSAVWSERLKTVGIWSPIDGSLERQPARQRVRRSLDALAYQMAAAARKISGGSAHRGASAPSSAAVHRRLHRALQEEFLNFERDAGRTTDSNEELKASFQQASSFHPIVQFHINGDDIISFVHRSGEVAVNRIENGCTRLSSTLTRWSFIQEAELLPDYPGGADRLAAEQGIWSDLADWLWKPLGISSRERTVLIIPEGLLANIPWEALECDSTYLGERHHFVVAPSLRHHLAAQSRNPLGKGIYVMRGAGDDIPAADWEIEQLRKRGGAGVTVLSECSRDLWPAEGDAHIWHFAGHARLRRDNPFYSSLTLTDGPLFAADFRLMGCKVELVTLAACRSGEQVAMPGEESSGLIRSLLEMGARTIIASRWPVSDKTAATWMDAFYDKYLNGSSIYAAVRCAGEVVRSNYPSAFHWAAFGVYGATKSGELINDSN